MAAECKLSVSGELCGVLAIGRCGECGRAFCLSHQGGVSELTPLQGIQERKLPNFCREHQMVPANRLAATNAHAQQQVFAEISRNIELLGERTQSVTQIRLWNEWQAPTAPLAKIWKAMGGSAGGYKSWAEGTGLVGWPVGDVQWKYGDQGRTGGGVASVPTAVTADRTLFVIEIGYGHQRYEQMHDPSFAIIRSALKRRLRQLGVEPAEVPIELNSLGELSLGRPTWMPGLPLT